MKIPYFQIRRLTSPFYATVLAVCGFLAACSELELETENLTAKTKAVQMGPDCAGCHGYPLNDTNHVFHLFKTDSNITSNRPITCLHCHSLSMAGHDVSYADSIYQDSNGNEFHSLDFPDDPELRTFTLLRVESLVKNRPVDLPARPGRKPLMQEWMTALAHMNGVVDVDFDSSSIDTVKFHGAKAFYSPRELTCSAVACHPNHGDYRWAIPSKGLPILKGDTMPMPPGDPSHAR